MGKKILVPLDGSELSAGILERIKPLIESAESLMLLGVVNPDPQLDADAQQKEVRERGHELEETKQALAREGLTVEVQLDRGDPASRILAWAHEMRADLVTMATHGRTGLTRLLRGSVAERVLRHCKSPLLLCNPAALSGDQPFDRILVPLDGSELAAQILPHVVDLAQAFGSEVVLLRIQPFIAPPFPHPPPAGSWNPQAVADTLAPHKRLLEQAGIATQVRAVQGEVATEILAAAAEVGLVAMSSHGRSGASRWLFGSVAEQVLRHASRPLFVRRVTA